VSQVRRAQEDGRLHKSLSQVNAGSRYPVLPKIHSHPTNVPNCRDSAAGFYIIGLRWFDAAPEPDVPEHLSTA